MEIYYQKKNYENATNLMIHDHHLTKDSRIITLGKLAPIKIYSIQKFKIKLPLIFISKISLITIIFTGQ